MDGQVVVGAVGDAFELAPLAALEAEAVLDVDGAGRVVRALFLGNVEAAHVVRVDAQVNEPVPAVLNPLVEVLISVIRVHKVLNFHLLELTSTEIKLPGVISLRNDLPIWPIPNGGRLREAVTTLLKFTKIP